ncbi:uncharacterized protein BDV14DRAFT_178348, partial [Aspergillus stella-maris]|uniref:uncharacterized protein n=1 Tax=Aspergillus stella-maris TaxID=1810926 RepID=UPI003CCD3DB1
MTMNHDDIEGCSPTFVFAISAVCGVASRRLGVTDRRLRRNKHRRSLHLWQQMLLRGRPLRCCSFWSMLASCVQILDGNNL